MVFILTKHNTDELGQNEAHFTVKVKGAYCTVNTAI